MTTKDSRDRSVQQRVANLGQERKLSRKDAFAAYAMDRLLYRLGRSRHARAFLLKGGILVAELMDAPYRFTRDIDLLRKRGPAKPDDLRAKFRDIASVGCDDGVQFDPDEVRAAVARRETEGYEGVQVTLKARVGPNEIDIKVDIGFSDAIAQLARRIALRPFLSDDPPAQVYAYQVESVLAEKIQTLISKWPAVAHRLKDILDVATLAASEAFEGDSVLASLRATFERRRTDPDLEQLDAITTKLRGKRWETDWATMHKEKAVVRAADLKETLVMFERFVRPLLTALHGGRSPGRWPPGGPWAPG